MKTKLGMVILGVTLIVFNACTKNDNGVEPESNSHGSKYVFVVYSDGTAGEAANYIVTTDNLDGGEISIKNNGVETSAYSFLVQNNTLFGITYANYGPTQAFKLNGSGVLEKTGGQVNTEFTGAYTPIDNNAYVGVSLSNDAEVPEAVLYKYDALNFKVDARKSFSLGILDNGENAEYTGIKEVDNKLYMPLTAYPKQEGQVSKYVDSAWIAVFDKASLQYQKVIRDGRIGAIGNWFGMQGVEQINNGDVYAWSTSGGNSTHQSKNPSAIIKINSTTDEVDKNYFFNVEEVSGKKIARGTYLKDGKFLMTLYQNGTIGSVTGGRVNLAIIDVLNKTVTEVSGVPVHDQMPYDNKTFVDDNGNTAYYVLKDDNGNLYAYKIEVDAAKATKGTRFAGIQNVTAISKLTY